jgi:hypothetical protein
MVVEVVGEVVEDMVSKAQVEVGVEVEVGAHWVGEVQDRAGGSQVVGAGEEAVGVGMLALHTGTTTEHRQMNVIRCNTRSCK